ncbi:MAG: aminoglycoside phosphotransferase family protein [Candidatus Thorarchaeota archaeon]|jgi:aminoglycoside phosphotransferase (APT) family kinase protein
MTKRQISKVHGISITDLENLLNESCELIDDSVKLEREVIGGWSNINIRGKSSSLDFILKLPLPRTPDSSYYEYLHSTSGFFGKLGITGSPLSTGKLSNGLPYIIFEFLEGVTYDMNKKIGDLSEQEVNLLNQCLRKLHSQKPLGLRSHYSPLDYLLTYRSMVETHQGLSKCSDELSNLIQSFVELEESILEYAELLGSWSMTVMHGDFWIPNVVFQPEKAFLLDFEECTFGEHNYDLARMLESQWEEVDIPPSLLEGYDERRIEELRPIALGWIVWWNFERLLSMESDRIEPNLNTPEIKQGIMDYTEVKIQRLKDLI